MQLNCIHPCTHCCTQHAHYRPSNTHTPIHAHMHTRTHTHTHTRAHAHRNTHTHTTNTHMHTHTNVAVARLLPCWLLRRCRGCCCVVGRAGACHVFLTNCHIFSDVLCVWLPHGIAVVVAVVVGVVQIVDVVVFVDVATAQPLARQHCVEHAASVGSYRLHFGCLGQVYRTSAQVPMPHTSWRPCVNTSRCRGGACIIADGFIVSKTGCGTSLVGPCKISLGGNACWLYR